MKRLFFILTLFISIHSFAQEPAKYFNITEALRIESFLASDDLRGRKPGTPEIDKAADFIAAEFKKSGLSFLSGLENYRQSFSNIHTKFLSATATVDDIAVEEKNIIGFTTDSTLSVNETSGFAKIIINNTENLLATATEILLQNKNTIVLVNSFFINDFNKLKRFKNDGPKMSNAVVFILSNAAGDKYLVNLKNKVTETKLANVVGILPGKSKKDEYVVFSSHYDHLGVGKPSAAGDSIYNGANDDAAGTTAVIMLAKYFASLKNNERTLIFVTFTAEETGGFGSRYFSKNIPAAKAVAMFNLEMIGTESKWGKNSAYITGYEKSDFGKILQKNLEGTAFHFEPDPYPSQNLFYRSDNATLAALGVPAHTISTSKMDSEPNYHKQSDEISSLDITNMAEVIKAIALSSKSIISGKDTPSRIEKIN